LGETQPNASTLLISLEMPHRSVKVKTKHLHSEFELSSLIGNKNDAGLHIRAGFGRIGDCP
jgi:hypothetical protein